MFAWHFLIAAQSAPRLLQQLSPLNQLRVIMGLGVVVVLGLVLFLIIRAGSHMVRGLSAAADRLPESSLPDEDDWARPPRGPESHE